MEAIVAAIISATGMIIAAVITARANRQSHVRPLPPPARPKAPLLPTDKLQEAESERSGTLSGSPSRHRTLNSEEAATPATWKVLISFVVPGLGSLLLRGWEKRGLAFMLLFFAIPTAYLIFGPLWGEVLFSGSQYKETGLWPFLATCVVVPIISLALAYSDRVGVSRNA